jgi:hypothetical protein
VLKWIICFLIRAIRPIPYALNYLKLENKGHVIKSLRH